MQGFKFYLWEERHIPLTCSYNRKLQSRFKDSIFFRSSIDLINIEKHVINCW